MAQDMPGAPAPEPATAELLDIAGPSAGNGAEPQVVDDGVSDLVTISEIPYGSAWLVPRRGASPLQHRLAEANAKARASSLSRLAAWFPGYDFEEAAQNVDDRRFAVIDLGTALVDHLRGDEMLDRLLFDHRHGWGHGGISFSHGDHKGHQPPPPYAVFLSRVGNGGRLDPGGLAHALDERWTAIINGADRLDKRLSEVCLHLTRAFGGRVNTNIYMSYGPSKGFGAHWDTHDTIIVPIRGAKQWSLFEPSVLSAQIPWISREVTDRPVWEGVIEPGLALVIPRGWGHRVDGSDDLSVHCTIGVNRLEIRHLFERVEFESGFWPRLRADVPYEIRDPVRSYGGSIFDDPAGFARSVAEVATPEMLERAVASYRARIERYFFSQFETAFDAVALNDWTGLALQLSAPAGVMLQDQSGGEVILAFNDRSMKVREEALDVVVALTDCQPWGIEDLPTVGGSAERRAELARALATNGLASVHPA
jgi:hypothetical protein